ncbi:hypothetical protein FK531_05570 [Rhodococcus spelaei]|uniref:Uncharacterized protein n=1 Tax=Rhodococcus spelaei TaxID=2546320 RepID=A0A541BP99_9NOCA|nr:hypothetical protein [Rhodococcus spelaei]TQF74120.1 hypothetical protein FK531_05570 [Rhodococcus spelaei]
MKQEVDAAVAAARTDPTVARSLFDLARYGCRDAADVDRLLSTFTELGIPTGTLGHQPTATHLG